MNGILCHTRAGHLYHSRRATAIIIYEGSFLTNNSRAWVAIFKPTSEHMITGHAAGLITLKIGEILNTASIIIGDITHGPFPCYELPNRNPFSESQYIVDWYTEREMFSEEITYLGNRIKVTCDGICSKAWGRSLRERDNNHDMITDRKLGIAPADPGTYEGGEGKPASAKESPNPWCVRECERCSMQEVKTPTRGTSWLKNAITAYNEPQEAIQTAESSKKNAEEADNRLKDRIKSSPTLAHFMNVYGYAYLEKIMKRSERLDTPIVKEKYRSATSSEEYRYPVKEIDLGKIDKIRDQLAYCGHGRYHRDDVLNMIEAASRGLSAQKQLTQKSPQEVTEAILAVSNTFKKLIKPSQAATEAIQTAHNELCKLFPWYVWSKQDFYLETKKAAINAWRMEYPERRIPGSTATLRLRKKRMKALKSMQQSEYYKQALDKQKDMHDATLYAHQAYKIMRSK